MLLGLERGLVMLSNPQQEWAVKAAEIILLLKELFGDRAIDIQHVGSTAIPQIKAKPILDIAVGVDGLEGLDNIFLRLEKVGIYKSSTQPLLDDIFCAMKETRESEIVVCNIHLEIMGGVQWKNHIYFRDYMNTFPEKAEFENMKLIAKLGIPMQKPVDFGTCNDESNVFLLLTWVDGEDAEGV